MVDYEIKEIIEFQGKELRDIIEHSVILASSRILDNIEGLNEAIEELNEHVEKIEESLKLIASSLDVIADRMPS